MQYNIYDIYWADVKFEDNPKKSEKCPILILSDNITLVLASKITHHSVRANDPEDYQIIKWKEAGLKQPSVVRVRRSTSIYKNKIYNKIGRLQKDDISNIWDMIKNKKGKRESTN